MEFSSQWIRAVMDVGKDRHVLTYVRRPAYGVCHVLHDMEVHLQQTIKGYRVQRHVSHRTQRPHESPDI